MPHSVTKFSPSYLLLGHLPYDHLHSNNNYLSVDEAHKLVKKEQFNIITKTK